MHTGDWWWKTQMTLPAGCTLVPVILTSDQTFLTNFSGDKKLWPLFMSIGNIPSHVRNKPTAQAWILIGLLLIGPKRTKGIKGFSTKEQEYDALRGGGYEVACADEKVRNCVPILSCWLADHMENVTIHGIKTNRYPICIATKSQLGMLSKTPYRTRNHLDYERLFQAGDVDK
ncbi:hypothetical protein BGX38DRAFT_1107338 [Terfezia claveryi]|nr:hypothetical protein BGX38DRAFT_1107338 [Terfezia claveryi]